jgi:surface polysaccharide O-acyltransferase-like enzyme
MLSQRSQAEYKSLINGVSDSIRTARVICIFFMTYVHVHLFADADLQNSPQFQTALSLIREVAGRASVPLLSVVSGFLFVGYLSRRSHLIATKDRARGLLVPIITWNLVGILIFSILDGARAWTLNDFFPFTDHGFQHHLTFLRDLFVVSLLSPILIRALKYAPFLSVASVILITAFVDTWPIILRTPILMYFTFGLLFGLYRLEGLNIYKRGRYLAYAAFAAFLLHAAVSGVDSLNKYFNVTSWIIYPVSALTFWGIAQWTASQANLMRIVKILEPAVFLLYLSHGVTGRIIAGIYAQLDFAHTPWIYTLTWLAIPLVCFSIALIGRSTILRLPAPLSLAVTGKS